MNLRRPVKAQRFALCDGEGEEEAEQEQEQEQEGAVTNKGFFGNKWVTIAD